MFQITDLAAGCGQPAVKPATLRTPLEFCLNVGVYLIDMGGGIHDFSTGKLGYGVGLTASTNFLMLFATHSPLSERTRNLEAAE